MTTDAEIRATIRDYQSGQFPPVRVPWDYRQLSAFPPKERARIEADEARVAAGTVTATSRTLEPAIASTLVGQAAVDVSGVRV